MSGQLITLRRPTGPPELELVEATGLLRWLAQLPDQAICFGIIDVIQALR